MAALFHDLRSRAHQNNWNRSDRQKSFTQKILRFLGHILCQSINSRTECSCTPHLTRDTLHSTLYTPHFTLYTPHFKHHTLHFTLHTLHFTPHTLHSTLYTPSFFSHHFDSGVCCHTCEHSGSWASSCLIVRSCAVLRARLRYCALEVQP